MFVDGGPIDHAGDGDELLAGGVRAGADSGHQQRAAQQLTARAPRNEPLDEKYGQYGHQQEQQTEFPHDAMVGLLT
ncbi:hypothetical protein MMAN_56430 [Mycobacterium mantenii]|uniref:Uncharacterized protein n=1 Tax=Mycobacterium mantenii TaxID=560555 RepID=A0ABN6AJ08_MYCNT|nr:hypothetical protein MMAN_56430 [Mycobacterium mantenii]